MIEFSKLPYGFDKLEPYMSEETLRLHHGKHYAKYVATTNQLVTDTPYDKMDLPEVVTTSFRKHDHKIFNNAAQAWNHSFFWQGMTPDFNMRIPSGLSVALQFQFGSVPNFQLQFRKSAMDFFGSGWTWLVLSGEDELEVISTPNAENPLVLGKTPLLCCDLWEHAYYLDHQNEKSNFLGNFFSMVNWKFIHRNFEKNKLDLQGRGRALNPI